MGLFEPGRLGHLTLPNRIVMAPLGRARNDPDTRKPGALSVEYYRQRASAGLIISEATHVSAGSVSRPGTGAIHTAAQVEAWRRVTNAVHDAGGRIFQQLFHLGRKADPDRLPGRQPPPAPSAIAARGTLPGPQGPKPFPVPRPLRLGEIAALRDEFGLALVNASSAGFDGVELHAANGFLIEQFLRDDSNQRVDAYGGSIAARARFLLQLVDAALEVFGPEGVGVRLSPHFDIDGPGASDPALLYPYIAEQLGQRGIAYLHVIEPDSIPHPRKIAARLKEAFGGPFILAGEFTRDSAEAALAQSRADFIAFGRPFIANPDLVARFRQPEPVLNPTDEATWYSGGAHGYTDYPTLAQTLVNAG
ncbi:NADH:flavin oxidoreductase/NADH oxidase [Novosphingobium nitrogenifigens DSM 19370]|uniref:NADH:flavin oxidoreductase/NADH oxidase n=1 Tax=Novosphingobium nitrogenifigens DSM 19370 TaxID=983920 RepID=F1Z4P0_9SPHN|nr:alkene reductase [Novosphingobium nitrogenifigens]EGD60423.1 NADH:flavin oxidoreductase/NADH oxidase [Novosphingobium nitrogenifigens DSM 19370]